MSCNMERWCKLWLLVVELLRREDVMFRQDYRSARMQGISQLVESRFLQNNPIQGVGLGTVRF